MKKSKRTRSILVLMITGMVALSSIFLYPYYTLYKAGNLENITGDSDQLSIFISEKIQFKDLGVYMKNNGWIRDEVSFNKVIKHKDKGDEWLLPGIQLLKKEWDNKTLVNQLYLGRNLGEVEITFNHVRLKKELAERLCSFVSASEEEVEESEEEEEEVFEIEINGTLYYTTDEKNGDIYKDENGEIGNICGKITDGDVIFF